MAHPDVDRIVHELMPFALQQIEREGTFHPYGAYLIQEGEVVLAMEDEARQSEVMVEELVVFFQQQAGDTDLEAYGICIDAAVSFPDEDWTDAVILRLEHRSGESVQLLVPYRRVKGGPPELGEFLAQPMEPRVFVSEGGDSA